MSTNKRKIFTAKQKAKIALEASKENKTVSELCQEYGVHSSQINLWKKALLDNAESLFEGKRGPKHIDSQSEPDRLYAKIGQLNMEVDWLRKKLEIIP
ncbi:transposase [Gammaproteobacteria bacterium]|nr:transposase [Gammaproteobacteria bacterium]